MKKFKKLRKFLYRVYAKLMTAFGEIKVFRFPMFLVYDPDGFQVTGKQVLDVMELIRPGDVVFRGYVRYLDGYFIPSLSGYSARDPSKNIGKGFSHGAVYVGGDKVVHAVAEGVSEVSVVDFLQCDRVAVLRPRKGSRAAVATARRLAKADVPYDFLFSTGGSALYCFELVAKCYPGLRAGLCRVSRAFGLLRKDVYLA